MMVVVVLFFIVILALLWWIFEKMDLIVRDHDAICNYLGDLIEKMAELEEEKEKKS